MLELTTTAVIPTSDRLTCFACSLFGADRGTLHSQGVDTVL